VSWKPYAHNWRCIVKRFWIMLVAVAMAIVVALPAGAGKPVKPEKLPTLFDVKFEFTEKVGEEGEEPLKNPGFSTEQCTTDGSLTMEAGPGGRLIATGDKGTFKGTDVPLLDVYLPGLDWHRDYPYYADVADVPLDFNPDDYPDPDDYPLEDPPLVSDLTGCHGAGIDVFVDKTTVPDEEISIEQYPRFLMLTIRDGSVDFRWEADYYRESELTESTESKNPRKNQVNHVTTAWEGFSYLDNQLAWTGNWDTTTEESTGVVTGEINVEYFNYLGGREPFSGSPVQQVEFKMTISNPSASTSE
jgi:hypothetical protein